jgi:predicted RNase H-like HicB family nuclease
VTRKYLVIIERAGANFSAYAPDVPGCVATGATIDETEREIREAIEFHLEGLREDGLPIPEPTSTAEYVEVAS